MNSTRFVSHVGFILVLGLRLAVAQTSPVLVWSDEFNGPARSAPDATVWGFDTGAGGWGNGELETYTQSTDNAFLDGNGHLVIRALASGGGYTSARLKTQAKFQLQYGRLEARIKIPAGQGLWPAFWLLGSNITDVGWPACGEIDVMENIGREPATIHGTLHGPGYAGDSTLTGTQTLPAGAWFADDFHVYAVSWSPNQVQFLIDGQAYYTAAMAGLPLQMQAAFQRPFFVLLNLAVGGGWPGNPDGTTPFPSDMLVDNIRLYQMPAPPALSVDQVARSVAAGGSVTYKLGLLPQGGRTGAVNLACSGAPQGATCSVQPASVTLTGAAMTPVTMTVTTTARSQVLPRPRLLLPTSMAMGLAWLTTAWLCAGSRRRVATLALASALLAGCGGTSSPPPVGNGGSGTPAGTSSLTVTATDGTQATSSMTVQLTVN